MPSKSIRSELLDTTKLSQNKREGEQDFLQRVAKEISNLDDEDYRALSRKAKAWADDAVNKYNDGAEIPSLPGDDESSDEGRRTNDDENQEREEMSERTTNTESGRGGRRSAPPPKASGKKAAAPAEREREREEAPARGSNKKAAPAKSAGKRNGGEPKEGGLTFVRGLLAKNPDISVDDLATKCEDKGFQVSRMTLSTTRSGFRQDVKALQEQGLLKRTLIG